MTKYIAIAIWAVVVGGFAFGAVDHYREATKPAQPVRMGEIFAPVPPPPPPHYVPVPVPYEVKQACPAVPVCESPKRSSKNLGR